MNDEADMEMNQAQEQINLLTNSSELKEESLDSKTKYSKAINDMLSIKEKMLKTKIDLTSKETIVLDREKLAHFKTKKEQRDYWARQLKFQLMSITLGQEDEKSKEKIF